MKKRAKSAATWAEQYHSDERVRFVQELPCSACGVRGHSENAHVGRRSGIGRKGHYTEIAPLCRRRYGAHGCHPMLHDAPHIFVQRFPEFNAEDIAAETERKWAASQQGER